MLVLYTDLIKLYWSTLKIINFYIFKKILIVAKYT